MRVDPDAVQPKIPWGNGPQAQRASAAFFFAVGVLAMVSMPRDATNDDSVAGVVVAALAGAAWGIGIWLFDRWWGERPSVRPVSAELGPELRRRLPTTGLLLLGFVASYVVWRRVGAAYGFTFEFSLASVYIALVTPVHTRRHYVRRDLRAGLVEPTR